MLNSIAAETDAAATSTTPAPLSAAKTAAPEMISIQGAAPDLAYEVFDGPLDPNSNYTGFVEVIGECFRLLQRCWTGFD